MIGYTKRHWVFYAVLISLHAIIFVPTGCKSVLSDVFVCYTTMSFTFERLSIGIIQGTLGVLIITQESLL